MGCCETKFSMNENMDTKVVFELIEQNSLKKLIQLSKRVIEPQKKAQLLNLLNSHTITYKSLRVNALSYCVILGHHSIFEFLLKLGCDILISESSLRFQGISILEIICKKGYIELLRIYLPIYFENLNHFEEITTQSPQISNDLKPFPYEKYTPIQLAVIFDHISLISHIKQYLKDSKLKTPQELDLDYIEPNSGINSALLAVKYGNYPMCKFLYQMCKCDFTIEDITGSNAVKIAVEESRTKPNLPYLKIVGFLIEVVEINILESYQDILKVADNVNIEVYLLKYLESKGIDCSQKLRKTLELCFENDMFYLDVTKIQQVNDYDLSTSSIRN